MFPVQGRKKLPSTLPGKDCRIFEGTVRFRIEIELECGIVVLFVDHETFQSPLPSQPGDNREISLDHGPCSVIVPAETFLRNYPHVQETQSQILLRNDIPEDRNDILRVARSPRNAVEQAGARKITSIGRRSPDGQRDPVRAGIRKRTRIREDFLRRQT